MSFGLSHAQCLLIVTLCIVRLSHTMCLLPVTACVTCWSHFLCRLLVPLPVSSACPTSCVICWSHFLCRLLVPLPVSSAGPTSCVACWSHFLCRLLVPLPVSPAGPTSCVTCWSHFLCRLLVPPAACPCPLPVFPFCGVLAVSRCVLPVSVSSLREQWDAAKGRAERRRGELDGMLEGCRQFHRTYADLEQWLGRVEADLDARPIRPESPQHVQTLLKQHEVGLVTGVTTGRGGGGGGVIGTTYGSMRSTKDRLSARGHWGIRMVYWGSLGLIWGYRVLEGFIGGHWVLFRVTGY